MDRMEKETGLPPAQNIVDRDAVIRSAATSAAFSLGSVIRRETISLLSMVKAFPELSEWVDKYPQQVPLWAVIASLLCYDMVGKRALAFKGHGMDEERAIAWKKAVFVSATNFMTVEKAFAHQSVIALSIAKDEVKAERSRRGGRHSHGAELSFYRGSAFEAGPGRKRARFSVQGLPSARDIVDINDQAEVDAYLSAVSAAHPGSLKDYLWRDHATFPTYVAKLFTEHNQRDALSTNELEIPVATVAGSIMQ